MHSMTVQKFQDFVLVSFEKTPEFQSAIKPFIMGSDAGHVISVHPSRYDSFLKTVKKFNKDINVSESLFFDSQEPISDFMLTNHVITTKISELMIDDDDEKDEIDMSTDSSDNSPKQVRFAENTVTLENADTEVKICFKFNRQLVELIKAIRGRRYKPEQRAWYVPANQKMHLIEKLKNLKYNIVDKEN